MSKPARVLSEIRQAEKTNANEVEKLRGMILAQWRRIDFLTERLGEANIKLLYTMQLMEVKRTPVRSELILTGAPPQVESGTVLEFYRRERAAFVAKMETEYANHQREIARQAEVDQIERGQDNGNGETCKPVAFPHIPAQS